MIAAEKGIILKAVGHIILAYHVQVAWSSLFIQILQYSLFFSNILKIRSCHLALSIFSLYAKICGNTPPVRAE